MSSDNRVIIYSGKGSHASTRGVGSGGMFGIRTQCKRMETFDLRFPDERRVITYFDVG